jgi:uncharacterized membrane protein
MPEIIAIEFTDETVAGQAAKELERLAEDLPMDPDAIGVFVCERSGKSELMTSCHPTATAAWSKFWGVFFSLVMNESEESGIDLDFRRQVRAMLKPGRSVLLVVIERVGADRILAALSHFEGSVITHPLKLKATSELWSALDDGQVRI